MEQVCIVVPIYKKFQDLEVDELLSLKQLYKILGGYEIFFVGSYNFDFFYYYKLGLEFKVVSKYKKFKSSFFINIKGYNNLMLSPKFYRKFSTFKFMLIYQLDAYVFRNDLKYWCQKNYDYIGAPWFEGLHDGSNTDKLIGVGNGGFSLRKIEPIIALLNRYRYLKIIRNFWVVSKLNLFFPFSKVGFEKPYFFLFSNKETNLDINFCNNLNEDYLITQLLQSLNKNYIVAPIEDAIKFCFEVQPNLLYKKNDYKLPFGCHAWAKHEPTFWKSFIKDTDEIANGEQS